MLIIAHLSLMIISFLCLAAGVSIAIFGRRQQNWLKLHKIFNSAGLIGILSGAVMAVTHVILSGETHLAGWHPLAGLTAIILCGLTFYLGFYSFKAANKARVRTVHRLTGRASIIAIVATLILGLQIIGIF